MTIVAHGYGRSASSPGSSTPILVEFHSATLSPHTYVVVLQDPGTVLTLTDEELRVTPSSPAGNAVLTDPGLGASIDG